MKIAEVNACIKEVQRDLGESLQTTHIVGIQDGQSIAGFNSDPKLEAIVAQITSFLQGIVKNTAMKQLGEYYFIHLDDESAGVFIVFDEYVWTIIFDTTKTPMGMVLNVYLPELMEKFEAAMK